MSELKSCPFCGVFPNKQERNPVIPHKENCIFTTGHVLHVSEYKSWNTRRQSQQVKRAEVRLDKIISLLNDLQSDGPEELEYCSHQDKQSLAHAIKLAIEEGRI